MDGDIRLVRVMYIGYVKRNSELNNGFQLGCLFNFVIVFFVLIKFLYQ